MPDRETLESLFSRACDGSASADDWREMEAHLRADRAALDAWIRYADLHASLATGAAARRGKVVAFPPVRRWPTRIAALAAAVALLATLAWFFARPALRNERAITAVEVEVLEARDTDAALVSGQRAQLSTVQFSSGSLRFRLSSGAVVEASGPAEIELRDAMHLRVLRGNVTADVGDKARGFVIETVNARVVDLGTRFGVSVGRSGDTDVVVFEGKVEVFDPSRKSSGQSALASLTEGDAVRMNAARIPERLSSVPMRGDSHALAAQSSHGIVTAVTDNFSEKGFNRYYGVASGAMQDNARAYTTMTRAKWHAVAGDTFPEELRGADVVATFHEDRKDRDLHIRLKVSAACAVYVLLDTRGQVPDWVQAGYRDTGIRLRSGPWNPVLIVRDIAPDADGNLYVTCAVWRKDIPSAGVVELGPPYAKGQPSNRAMYGIAVQALK